MIQSAEEEKRLLAYYSRWYKVHRDGTIERTEKSAHKMAANSKPKILKPDVTKDGYQRVTLCQNGRKWRKGVHRLVALTYIPTIEDKPLINHIDGNPSNNNVENLEWCDYSENLYHAYNTLSRDRHYGTARKWTKLTEKAVLDMRALSNPNVKELANKYNVSCQCIKEALAGITFKHI